MFQLAVIGIVAPHARGITRGCVECRAATGSFAPCNGFGPGCLVGPRPQEAPPASPSSRFSRA